MRWNYQAVGIVAALTAGIAVLPWTLQGAPSSEKKELPASPVAPSQVVAVTVYQNHALVSRDVTVPESTGHLEVVVSSLPPQVLTGSLYAEGAEGIRVLSARSRSRELREDNRAEVRELNNQIKQISLTNQRLNAEIKTIETNLTTLAKMETFTSATLQHMTDKGALNSEATINLAKYIMTTRAERAKEIVTLQQQVAENTEQLNFLNRQLREKSAGSAKTELDAVIVLDKKVAGPGRVRLSYLVNAVAWRPHYKFRAGKSNEPVIVEYLASVQQQTGEDWENVKLVLSTAQPMLNSAPPELKTLEVAVRPISGPGGKDIAQGEGFGVLTQQSQNLRAKSAENYVKNNPFDASRQINDAAALEQFRDVLSSRDDLSRRSWDAEMPSVTYHLPTKMSLPSRNDEQTLEVTRLELKPEFFFKATPVLTPHVYRQADLTNKSDYVLLPGEATMYQGTDFVGQSRLPLVAIGKQFTVGFGIDPQLQVTRQMMNKERSTQGGNQVLKFDYRILLSSYKSEPVKVQVWDRLPHAESSSVAVTLVSQKPELSADPLYRRDEREKNLLRWDVVVRPQENGEKSLVIDYQYKLELDKLMTLGSFLAK